MIYHDFFQKCIMILHIKILYHDILAVLIICACHKGATVVV